MNPWKRNGFSYEVHLVIVGIGYKNTITKRLDFITYHLIKWIHGEDELIRMAKAPPRGNYK